MTSPSSCNEAPEASFDKLAHAAFFSTASLSTSQQLTLEQIHDFLAQCNDPEIYYGEPFIPVHEFDGNPRNLIINTAHASELRGSTSSAIVPPAADCPMTPALSETEHTDSDSLDMMSIPSSPATSELLLFPRTCDLRRREPKFRGKDTPKISNNRMKKHVREERRFPCQICNLKFSRRYNLKTHMLTHDANRKRRYECALCDRAFDRKHDRDRHQTTVHSGKKAYTCKICKNSFTRKDALNRHICHA